MSSKPKSSSKERAKSKTESRNASRGKAPKQRQLSTSHDKLSDAKGSTTSSSIHEGGEILFVDSTTVDFSGQGAAVIPATLFTRREIEVLNISNNNLRNIPSDISVFSNLRVLNISRNNFYTPPPPPGSASNSARSDSRSHSASSRGGPPPSLPEEIAELPSLVELNLAECNLAVIPPVVFRIESLRSLNIGRNKIGSLPGEIANLSSLVTLNIQYCELKELPAELICCEQLEELVLYGNPLESLPPELFALSRLHTLRLSAREFAETAHLDAHTEQLIARNQLHSVHIPNVIFELPALRALDLTEAKLNTLPASITQSLEHLSLRHNYFRSLPYSMCQLSNLTYLDASINRLSRVTDDIRNLRSLKHLDLSQNELESVPASVCELLALEWLNVSRNRIAELPAALSALSRLRTLLAAQNLIKALPDAICQLTELHTLDVSENQVSRLPKKMYRMSSLLLAHSYEGFERVGLWLKGNPLVVPPATVWKVSQTAPIWAHLRALELEKVEHLQPLKIVMLGVPSASAFTQLPNTDRECGCGKSSLVNAVLEKLGCELADVRYAITRKNVEDALLRRKFGGDDSQDHDMKDAQKQNEELMESLIRGHKKSRAQSASASATEAAEKDKDKEKKKGTRSTPSAPANVSSTSLNQTPTGAEGEGEDIEKLVDGQTRTTPGAGGADAGADARGRRTGTGTGTGIGTGTPGSAHSRKSKEQRRTGSRLSHQSQRQEEEEEGEDEEGEAEEGEGRQEASASAAALSSTAMPASARDTARSWGHGSGSHGTESRGELFVSYFHRITRLCEIRRGKTPGENGVPLCFYDMSGHPVYSELFPLLADQRALFLVVFSASDYVASILNAFSRYSVQREEYREAVLAEAFEQHVGQYVRRVWSLFPCALVQLVGTHWEPAVEADLSRCLRRGPLGPGDGNLSLSERQTPTGERPSPLPPGATAGEMPPQGPPTDVSPKASESAANDGVPFTVPAAQVPTFEAEAAVEAETLTKQQQQQNLSPSGALVSIAEDQQQPSPPNMPQVDAGNFLRGEVLERARRLVESFNVDTRAQLEAWLTSSTSSTSFPMAPGDSGRAETAASRLAVPSLARRPSNNDRIPSIDALISTRRTRWDAPSPPASEKSSAVSGLSPRPGAGAGSGPGAMSGSGSGSAGMRVENLCVLDEELPLTSLVSPLAGVEELTRALERVASRHPALRHLRAYVPDTWHVVRKKLKNLRRLHSSITEIQVFAGVYGVKDFELYEMLSLWASTGDFIWVRHPRQIAAATAARIHPLQQQGMSQFIVLRPAELMRVFARLYRHDLQEWFAAESVERARLFRYVARLESYEELEAASALALRYGQLSEPVLTALASDASDANPLPNVMRAWLRLASLFQLAYEVPSSALVGRELLDLNDADGLDSIPPAQPAHTVPVVVVPALATDPAPPELLEQLMLGNTVGPNPKTSSSSFDATSSAPDSPRSSGSSQKQHRSAFKPSVISRRAVVRASPEMPALEVLHALGIAMQPELTARVDWADALWGLVAVDRVEFLIRVEPDDDETSGGGLASASGGRGSRVQSERQSRPPSKRSGPQPQPPDLFARSDYSEGAQISGANEIGVYGPDSEDEPHKMQRLRLGCYVFAEEAECARDWCEERLVSHMRRLAVRYSPLFFGVWFERDLLAIV